MAIDLTGAGRHTTGVAYYSLSAARAVALAGGPKVDVSVLRHYSLRRPGAVLEHRDLRSRWAPWPREALHRLPALDERTRFRPDRPVEVFHASETVLRPVSAGAVVVTVHDLGALRGIVPPGGADLPRTRRLFAEALERADAVLVVSEAARRDLEAVFPRQAGRARVVYPAPLPAVPRPVPGCPEPFVAFVGATNGRKDLDVLLRAVARLRHRGEWPADLALVLAGPAGDAEGDLARLAAELGLGELLRRLGYLPDDGAVEWLIRHARCFAYPGRHEGFGFPAVRAMAGRVPVVACAAGAIPEVTAGAAALFDPGDDAGLAEVLGTVLHDGEARERMGAAGAERAAAFRPEAFGAGLLEVYREVVGA